jgi:hypothetical protein
MTHEDPPRFVQGLFYGFRAVKAETVKSKPGKKPRSRVFFVIGKGSLCELHLNGKEKWLSHHPTVFAVAQAARGRHRS